MSCELLVLGGGAAGIASARAGVRRGHHTVLVQGERIGGECTFTGSVPSTTLIEATARGLSFNEATARIQRAIETIAPTESAEVLSAEGIEVVLGRGRLIGRRRLTVGKRSIQARRTVIATGSVPLGPQVPGLAEVGYLTNDSVFDLVSLPASIACSGAGQSAVSSPKSSGASAPRSTSSKPTRGCSPKKSQRPSATLKRVFSAEGIVVHLGVSANGAGRPEPDGPVHLQLADGSEIRADALRVAVGRRPNTEGIDPAAGGIELDARGYVRTNRYLATSAPGVYAAGDVTGHAVHPRRRRDGPPRRPQRLRTTPASSLPLVGHRLGDLL